MKSGVTCTDLPLVHGAMFKSWKHCCMCLHLLLYIDMVPCTQIEISTRIACHQAMRTFNNVFNASTADLSLLDVVLKCRQLLLQAYNPAVQPLLLMTQLSLLPMQILYLPI